MAARRRLAVVVAGAAAAFAAGGLAAQVPFDGGRAYNQCAADAYRRAGPAPRTDPRPGDDLALLQRRQRDYEDRYYRALDQCLRESDRRRLRNRD